MSESGPAGQASAAQIAQLTAAIAQLSARVDDLERRTNLYHPPGDLREDVVLAISAACAAYLGHRAKVKQVHVRRRSNSWATMGRSDVQHSHHISHGQTW